MKQSFRAAWYNYRLSAYRINSENESIQPQCPFFNCTSPLVKPGDKTRIHLVEDDWIKLTLPPQVLWSMSWSPGVQSHSNPIAMSLQMWEQPPLFRRHSFTSAEREETSGLMENTIKIIKKLVILITNLI